MEKQLFQEIVKWQQQTFPAATDLSKLHHLQKEVKELIEAIEAANVHPSIETYTQVGSEFADCFFLLYGAASVAGLSYDGITELIKEKFAVNKLRKWGAPDANRVIEHVEEDAQVCMHENCTDYSDNDPLYRGRLVARYCNDCKCGIGAWLKNADGTNEDITEEYFKAIK